MGISVSNSSEEIMIGICQSNIRDKKKKPAFLLVIIDLESMNGQVLIDKKGGG